MSLQAAALIGLGVVYLAVIVSVLSLCRAGGKPTPSPTSLQGTADRLRAMGVMVDDVFADNDEPRVHWRGGWRV